ncbi:MAG: tryptophan--tRNA ligase [Gammaproteobacteria bacterium]
MNPHSRIVSGMRPTGHLHLGHWEGVLKNWIELQKHHECYFFVADWHALTTHYQDSRGLEANTFDLVMEWLAVGVDPDRATLFVQSWVPEHAELHLLLSMLTPLGWLERVPTYKEQQQELKDRELDTYGFLGYPVLMSADVLLYRAGGVPVGQDQVAHLEVAREIARRFNFLYGRGEAFDALLRSAHEHMGSKQSHRLIGWAKQYRESGASELLNRIAHTLAEDSRLDPEERAALFAEARGSGREILPEPEALLTRASRLPGTDGRKMSKSYDNAIALRDDRDVVTRKIRTMATDPARVRRSDPGEPDRCPVWKYHEAFSTEETRQWVETGCRTAGIGCLDCKNRLLEGMLHELEPVWGRLHRLQADPDAVREVLASGSERARIKARETLGEVRNALGLARPT